MYLDSRLLKSCLRSSKSENIISEKNATANHYRSIFLIRVRVHLFIIILIRETFLNDKNLKLLK